MNNNDFWAWVWPGLEHNITYFDKNKIGSSSSSKNPTSSKRLDVEALLVREESLAHK